MTKLEKFFNKSADERLAWYTEQYVENKLSWGQIAKELGTYTNKVRRDATKLGVTSRTKNEAQKVALAEGRSVPPMEGKTFSEESKIKISESLGRVWDEMSDEEKKRRSEIHRRHWDNLSEQQKADFRRRGQQGMLKASREGSKLEKYLFEGLTKLDYRPKLHQEHMIGKQAMHVDIFIPGLRVAVEIDGPCHYRVVYGQDTFDRVQRSDKEKNERLLNAGFWVIRMKHDHKNTGRYLRRQLESLCSALERVKSSNNEDRTVIKI